MDRIGIYTLEDLEKIEKIQRIVEEIGPRLPYHNAVHMKDVAKVCDLYAVMEGLDYRKRRGLRKAGELHDVYYVGGREDNEEIAADMSRNILWKLGDPEDEIEYVGKLILATKYPTSPQDLPEKIICDADIDNIGREDFLEKSELLRKEFGFEKEEWYKNMLPKFLENARFYTPSARLLREARRKENLERVGGMA